MYDYVVNSRKYSVIADKYGIDPLRDKILDQIAAIQQYTLYDVKQSTRGRPDLLAYQVYQNSNLWWVIMYYNGILSFRDVKEGLTLKIPITTEVTRILADVASQSTKLRSVKI